MTDSLHGWLHDGHLGPPSVALTCVPPVGLEPTALGLGIARAVRTLPSTCCFGGTATSVAGSRRDGRRSDVDRAIELLESGIALIPAGHPEYPGALSNLGLALELRAGITRRPADLERAIEIMQRALAALPNDHPDRAGVLSNLARAAQGRFALTENPAELAPAIEWAAVASEKIPADHPSRSRLLFELGLSHLGRAIPAGDAAGLAAAESAFRDAARVSTAPAGQRADAAASWGAAAAERGDWPSAVAGFSAAIELMAVALPRSLSHGYRQQLLQQLSGVGSAAAACCLQLGQVDRAIELWEQGRGILLGQVLDLRTDMTRLAEAHPRLAAEFTALRAGLDTDVVPPPGDGGKATRDAPVTRLRELATRFDQLVALIRSTPGFDRFLLPPALRDLLAAAKHGPVVLLNVSEYRSDALLLTSGGPVVVPLPEVTPEVVHERMMNMLIALLQHRSCECGPDAHAEDERNLADVLDWLWRAIAVPVLSRLDLAESAEPHAWPRIWWCPSGELSLFPLHAAGRHGTRTDPVPQTVLDRVVSSYTPSVRALLHARRPAPSDTDGAQADRVGWPSWHCRRLPG